MQPPSVCCFTHCSTMHPFNHGRLFRCQCSAHSYFVQPHSSLVGYVPQGQEVIIMPPPPPTHSLTHTLSHTHSVLFQAWCFLAERKTSPEARCIRSTLLLFIYAACDLADKCVFVHFLLVT